MAGTGDCRRIIFSLLLIHVFLTKHVSAHFYPNFHHGWGPKQWHSREYQGSSSSSLSSSSESGSKKSCDPWISQTLASLRSQVSALEKKLGMDCQPEAKDTSSLCQPGYHYVQGRCYRFSQARLTWHKARFNCTWDGAELVALETAAEEQALDKVIIASPGYKACTFFTLGNDQEYKGFWLWGTGSNAAAVIYKNWAKGEPNDHGTEREACIEYNPSNGWNDIPCGNQLGFICEMAPGYSYKDLMKNTTTKADSSEKKSSSSSTVSSTESQSDEKDRSRRGKYNKRKSHYKYGSSPPWSWRHHGRVHHSHPHRGPHHHHYHHHDRHHGPPFSKSFRPPFFGGYDNHRRNFHDHRHGGHKKRYHGSHGHFSKHRVYRYDYHRSNSDTEKSKSKSEESNSNSRENRVDKESSSEERKHRNHQYHNRQRFHHKPWYHHRFHGHYGGGEFDSREIKYRKKSRNRKSSHENHTPRLQSYFSRVVESWAKFRHHAEEEPEAAVSLLHYFYPSGIFFVPQTDKYSTHRVKNNTNSNTTSTNEIKGNLTMNGNKSMTNETNEAMTKLNLTEGMSSNSSHLVDFNAENKSMGIGLDSKERINMPYGRHNGVYVYSYLPPHHPQQIFYPGLAPPLFRPALHHRDATVHLRRGYYYNPSPNKKDKDQSGNDMKSETSANKKPVVDIFSPWVPFKMTKTSIASTAITTTAASTTDTSSTVATTATMIPGTQ